MGYSDGAPRQSDLVPTMNYFQRFTFLFSAPTFDADDLEGKTASLINLMRKRGLEMPIMILVRRKRFEDIPVEVLDFIDGYVFLAEETPEFIAKNLVSRLKQYAETLKTPFFGALVDYSEEGNQLWTCPGHNGGIFYSRSPIGRIFVEHL